MVKVGPGAPSVSTREFYCYILHNICESLGGLNLLEHTDFASSFGRVLPLSECLPEKVPKPPLPFPLNGAGLYRTTIITPTNNPNS